MKLGTKGCPSLGNFSEGFTTILDFLDSSFRWSGYKQNIQLFSVYRVPPTEHQDKGTLYRADPCCHLGLQERYDWALFNTKQGQRVGQMICFLSMSVALIDSFNLCLPPDHGKLESNPGDYALVQLFQREVPGLVDTTIHHHTVANVMQANSVLFFFGTKQQRGGKPVTRLLPLSKISRPLVVIPDFHPTFTSEATGCSMSCLNKNKDRNLSYIVVRPRDLWHELFIDQAVMEHKKEMEEERRNQENKDHQASLKALEKARKNKRSKTRKSSLNQSWFVHCLNHNRSRAERNKTQLVK